MGRDPVEYVDVPFETGAMPCMFVKADVDGPAPVMIHIQGFDSLKEFHYPIIGEEYRRRGMHMLIVDQPGAGGALRLHGLATGHEAEHCVKALVDYVETRDDVDNERIGLSGNSLGGYYAPRAAAFEKRIKCCIAFIMAKLKAEIIASLSSGSKYKRQVAGFELINRLANCVLHLFKLSFFPFIAS